MTQVRDVLGRARPLAVAVAFVAASFVPLLSLHDASAGALLNRSLMTTSSVVGTDAGLGVPGEADNGSEVGHTYTFTPSTDSMTVRALSFEVCDSAFGYLEVGGVAGHCIDTPSDDDVAGFNVTGAWATGLSVDVGGSPDSGTWTFNKADNSYWTLTRDTDLVLTGTPVITITFDASASNYFTNPTAVGTYFVHVAAYGTTAAEYDTNFNNPTQDEGTVTNSTATAIDINTRVQETLKFSVEGDMRSSTVNDNSAGPTAGIGSFNGPTSAGTNCDPLDGLGTIRMGDQASNALASSTTYDAASYFRVATNSANGALVYYSGNTLSSGSETITAAGAPGTAIDDPGATNTEQFGLGFIAIPELAGAGTTTDVDRDGDGTSTYLRAINGYHDATANVGFVAGSPQLLAQSDGIVQCDTGAVRYIANIADETAAGIYTTRIVYIASPSY